MNDRDLYKDLGILTKDRGRWEESIPFLSSLLSHESVKIQAKAIWLLGEAGLTFPESVKGAVPGIASFLNSPAPLLRERALNALGRIGRGSFQVIEPYWLSLFPLAGDPVPKVRLSFVWASENIASNTPDLYEKHIAVYAGLLEDKDDRVRMEAPEFFRVVGKRRPDFVRPYLDKLRIMAESDRHPVVRIHCQGALKAAGCPDLKDESVKKIQISDIARF